MMKKRASPLYEGICNSKEFLSSVTQSASDAIISIDNDEKIIFWNRAAALLFGFSADEALGKSLSIIMPKRFRQAHKKGMKKFFLSPNPKLWKGTYEVNALRKDGGEFPVELSLSYWVNKQGIFFTGIIRDVTDRKLMEEKLREASITDELTGLLNRRGFLTLSEKQFQIARRNKRNFSIIFIDLNDMKTINDQFGHKAGDQALIDLAHILRNTFRSSDIIARVGGDEFIVLIIEPRGKDIEEVIKSNIEDNLRQYEADLKRNYSLSLSMGFAHFDPEKPHSIDELIFKADMLMYKQKQMRKNNQAYTHPSDKIKSEIMRRHERLKPSDTRAELVSTEIVSINNISMGGVCLSSPHQLMINSVYNISMMSPDNEAISTKGIVVWTIRKTDESINKVHNAYVAGLKFVNMNNHMKKSLKHLINTL